MSLISNAIKDMESDFAAADELSESIYQTYFAKYFELGDVLYSRFKDNQKPIDDKELEQIITILPLDLLSGSSALAQFKAHNEIVKLQIRQRKKIKEELVDIDTEYQLMTIIYNAVINRVESQITFSKELIMGAKKVWDARRKSDHTNPVNEVDELPKYSYDL